MPHNQLPSAARRGRAIAAMFFAFFGAAWLILGSVRSGHATALVIAPIILAALALFAFAYRRYKQNSSATPANARSVTEKRRFRLFNIINLTQWILILIAINVLVNLHLSAWVIPAILLIVGVHFLPLARLFSYPPHYITAAALILIAALYPFLAPAGPQSSIGCFLAGIVLWLSALYGLTLAPEPARS